MKDPEDEIYEQLMEDPSVTSKEARARAIELARMMREGRITATAEAKAQWLRKRGPLQ